MNPLLKRFMLKHRSYLKVHKQSYRAMTAGLKIVKLDESSIEQAAQLEKQVFK